MDELNSVGQDDLLKIIQKLLKRIEILEAELLRLKKIVSNL